MMLLVKNFENYLTNNPDCELHFEQINVSDVNKIIENLSSKTSCGFDDISLKLLKPVLATTITVIIDQVLNTGIFTDKLKLLKLNPYKKGINPTSIIIGKYHSFLPFLKILKK